VVHQPGSTQSWINLSLVANNPFENFMNLAVLPMLTGFTNMLSCVTCQNMAAVRCLDLSAYSGDCGRTAGARQTPLDAGKGVETMGLTELDLEHLDNSRHNTARVLQTSGFMRMPGVFQTR
jgi:hypothetical protein